MSFKVSVALCTYNGERHIEEQLDSILNQTVPPDEIIIGDDGSSDETVNVIKRKLTGTKVSWKLNVNQTNLGVVKNFENAIAQCTGDIIFTADQDDVWLENKVQVILHAFEENPDVCLVFTNAHLVNDQLHKTQVKLWDTLYTDMSSLQSNQDYFRILLKNNLVTGATMAFRRSFVRSAMPFSTYWMHDYWLAMAGSLSGNILGIDEALVLYRQHGNNVVGALKKSFSEKVRSFFRNFENLEEIRRDKYEKFASLKEFLTDNRDFSSSKDNMQLIEKGLEFWSNLHNLSSGHRIRGIFVIVKELRMGNYGSYYTGIRGAARDLFGLLRGKK